MQAFDVGVDSTLRDTEVGGNLGFLAVVECGADDLQLPVGKSQAACDFRQARSESIREPSTSIRHPRYYVDVQRPNMRCLCDLDLPPQFRTPKNANQETKRSWRQCDREDSSSRQRGQRAGGVRRILACMLQIAITDLPAQIIRCRRVGYRLPQMLGLMQCFFGETGCRRICRMVRVCHSELLARRWRKPNLRKSPNRSCSCVIGAKPGNVGNASAARIQ